MIKNNNLNGPVILVSKDIAYTFPFGYAYLAGYLLQRGENVKLMFRPENAKDFDQFADEIMKLKPLLVGLGTLYPDIYPVGELITILKNKNCDFPIIIGGQMVTPIPEFVTEITGADYAITGEGEITLYNLVTALRQKKDPISIKGLIVNNNGKMTNTGQGEFITDMKKLPPIPYHLFPSEKWLNVGQYYIFQPQPHWRYKDKIADIHGGRGCPFNCNFCYHHSQPRYRPIPDMIADAKKLIEEYDVNLLNFGDDLVITSPARAEELVLGIKSLPKKIEFALTCRFDILSRFSDELLLKMKQAGLRSMGLGVESGSQRILDIIHKRVTIEQIKNGFRRLKNLGIFTTVCIQVGQLGETNEDVQKSMDLMLETLRNDKNINWSFTITTPFPGTELYEIALSKGLLKDHKDFYNKFKIGGRKLGTLTANLSAMTDQEILNWRDKLLTTYRAEKKKLIGKRTWLIERLRMRLFRLYIKIDETLQARPNKLTALARKIMCFFHNRFQIGLEYLWLYFWGIYK